MLAELEYKNLINNFASQKVIKYILNEKKKDINEQLTKYYLINV